MAIHAVFVATAKTSLTDPLRVDWIDPTWLPPDAALGMSFAPGKVDPHARSGPWQRSLEPDLDRLVRVHGATTLVSIIEGHELERLKIPTLGAEVGRHGLQWIHVEVVDGSTPDSSQSPRWFEALRRVHAKLHAGERVVVHCMGGLGRTGTFVAALLTSFDAPDRPGPSPAEAIAECRRVRPGTVENSRQVEFVSEAQQRWRADLEARHVACLLAGAVGDALGAAVEFMSLAEIRRRHGHAGVHEYEPCYGGLGRITDDTQMTAFTAEGLIRAAAANDDPVTTVEHALWRWLWTQGDAVPPALAEHADGWVYAEPTLHSTRAPGNTCLSALRARVRARAKGIPITTALNDSKGCGAVMRAAPVGLLSTDAWTLGCETGRLTHEHPSGWDSAGLLAEMIAELVRGHSLASATQLVWRRRRELCHPDTRVAIDAAFALVREGVEPSAERVESLGGGWVGEEALAIALYCVLATSDFESALALAVSHGGDSDSTGAIAGNLLGAAHGPGVIPSRWLEPLEFRDGLTTLAKQLFEAAHPHE